jgi:signal transduction histidine kinase
MATCLDAQLASSIVEPVLESGKSHQLSVIRQVIVRLRELCRADGCVLWLWTEQGSPEDAVLFSAAEDFVDLDVPLWHYLSSTSPTTRAVREGLAKNFLELTPDDLTYDRDSAVMKQLEVKSFCTVPVWWPNSAPQQRAMGAVNFYRKQDQCFSDEEFELARVLAGLVPQLFANIINHASFHLLRRVSDDLHDSPRPNEIDLQSFPPTLSKTLTSILEAVKNTFNCLEASVYLQKPGEMDGPLHLVATDWPWTNRIQPVLYKLGAGLTGYCAKSQVPIWIFDLGRFNDDLDEIQKRYPGIQWSAPFDISQAAAEVLPAHPTGRLPPLSFLATPITEAGHCLGVLRCCVAMSSPYFFNQRQLELLSLVADEVGDWCGSAFRLQRANERRHWLQAYVEGLSELSRRAQFGVSATDRTALYEKALQAAAHALQDAHGVSIHLKDPRDSYLVYVAGIGKLWTGQHEKNLQSIHLPLRGANIRSAAADAFARNAVVSIADTSQSQYRCELFPEAEALILAPISVSSDAAPYGVVKILFSDKRLFSNQAVVVAEFLARQLALYILLDSTIGELRRTKSDLQRIVEFQIQTFENVQHQLKTPVFLAHRYVRRLMSNDRNKVGGDVSILKGQLRRTEQIVTNIGMFTDLARGQSVRVNRVGLNPDRFLSRISEAARDHGVAADPDDRISFNVDLPSFDVLDEVAVWLDEDLFDQMLDNLLDNASKYSDPDSVVSIRAGIVQKGQYFYISVSNRGRKTRVNGQTARHLAERGTRDDKAIWAGREGSGLGLYIVRELLAAHSGKLEIIPTTEHGITEFRLLFPTGSAGGNL